MKSLKQFNTPKKCTCEKAIIKKCKLINGKVYCDEYNCGKIIGNISLEKDLN